MFKYRLEHDYIRIIKSTSRRKQVTDKSVTWSWAPVILVACFCDNLGYIYILSLYSWQRQLWRRQLLRAICIIMIAVHNQQLQQAWWMHFAQSPPIGLDNQMMFAHKPIMNISQCSTMVSIIHRVELPSISLVRSHVVHSGHILFKDATITSVKMFFNPLCPMR